jgi:hypothetical protein
MAIGLCLVHAAASSFFFNKHAIRTRDPASLWRAKT